METCISLVFSKLSFLSKEIKNFIIELSYENKTETFNYPQIKPLILLLTQKIDKQVISINIKSKFSPGKKQKILAHGEIIIFKKLLSEKIQEKFVILFSKENERIRPNKDNIGKIFVQIKLEDSNKYKSYKKETKKIIEDSNKKENTKIIEDSNKKEQENKNNIIFDDNITDINASPIDEKFQKLYNIDEIISIEEINKLREIIYNEETKNDLLPKDYNSLKTFNQNLFNQYKDLNANYFNLFLNISKKNEELKQKANDYYKDYIELENELYKLRLESKQNKEEILQKTIEHFENKKNISQNLEEIKIKENKLFENINNANNISDLNQNYGNEKDLKNLCNLIKKLNILGYNIDNDDITDSEKQNLNDLLENIDNGNEEIFQDNFEQNELDKNNFELGNTIVLLIERDVNDLYKRKLIEQIKIDQIDAITYSFCGESKEKEVSLNIENNKLICSNGEAFTVWLIKNFSL